MKIVKISDIPKQPMISPLFTGPDVSRQPLAPDSQEYSIGVVNFGISVRNKFHTHESEQVLIVTAGTGVVATDDEQQVVNVGDVVWVPKGEKHWHGAVEGSQFSHIALTLAGTRTTQLED